MDKKRVHFLSVIGIALLLRLLLFVVASPEPDRFLDGDSGDYSTIAVNLMEEGAYSSMESGTKKPNFRRTPAYPLFLVLIYSVFGSANYTMVALVQVLIGTVSVILLYRILVKLTDPWIGFLGALVFALDPVSAIYANTVLTETLFTFFLVSGAYLFLSGIGSDSLWRYWFAGLVFGLAALARPIGLFLPLVLIVPILYRYRNNLLRSLPVAGVLLLGSVLMTAPWFIRNFQVGNTIIFSSTTGYNMLFYRGTAVLAMEEDRDPRSEEIIERLKERAEDRYTANMTEAEKSRVWWWMGMNIIKKRPVLYGITAAIGAGKMLFGPGRKSLARLLDAGNPPDGFLFWVLVGIESVFLIGFYVTVFVGFWFFFRTREFGNLIFFGSVLLYLVVVSAGPEAYSRFRVPLVPFLSVFAGAGLHRLLLKAGEPSEKD